MTATRPVAPVTRASPGIGKAATLVLAAVGLSVLPARKLERQAS
jgi:NADP-dependent 3-hydroxy acid dehydrogenase YdfG